MIKVIYPEYISIKNWAAALVADYPNEFLPILQDENKWKEWGSTVVSSGAFAKLNIPAPFKIIEGQRKDAFKTWQSWAKVFYLQMSNDTSDNKTFDNINNPQR
ncbi:MAG TPA: hypothetical protein VMV86_04095 [Methanosarcinales archaeon]|nr:hypothetical protein [Methanosarcinales archaeon]